MRSITVRFLLTGALVAVLAACTGAGSASPPPASGPPSAAAPSAEAPAGDPSDAVPPEGPVAGGSQRVDPQPGQQLVEAIPLERIEATAEGRTVTLTLSWSSGVEPCSVLDSVLLDTGDGEVAVTIQEGTADPDAICVLMLQAKHTVVSLDLDPGTWVIRDAQGGAQPVEVTVE